MNFEDDLRASFARADEAIEREALDFDGVVRRGRGLFVKRIVVAASAAALVLGGTLYVVTGLDDGIGRNDQPPIASPSESPSPEPSPSDLRDAELLVPHESVRSGDCSAAREAEPVDAQSELPDDVWYMRTNIIYAAWNCDYSELEKLTGVTDGEPFGYSYGASGDPAGDWQQEDVDFDTLARMVKVFASKPSFDKVDLDGDPEKEFLYTWPALAGGHLSDENWEAIEKIYPEEQVREWREETGYFGYRAGITLEGDWIFFIAGD